MAHNQGSTPSQNFDDPYGRLPYSDNINNEPSYPQRDYEASRYPPPGGMTSGYPSTNFGNTSSDSLADETAALGPGEKSGQYAGIAKTNRNSHKKRWIIVGVVAVLVVAAIAGGIAGWRVNASKNNPSSLASDSSSTSTNSAGAPIATGSLRAIEGTSGVVLSDPNDPSIFQKDPRLHLSFAGFAYTPFNALEPECGAVQANVTQDIQLLSQLTTRIRMYGAACNQSALVLQAIQDTKVNMVVWLGAYIGSNATVNTQQMTETINVLKTYGTKHVKGVIVGNEYILNAANPITAVTFLVGQMATFRNMLSAAGLNLPVGTADAGSEITTALATGSDFIMANVHPFFGGLPVAQAGNWTWDFFNLQGPVGLSALAPNKPPTYVAETGWPSGALNGRNGTLGGAVAGIPQLQTFLDTYPCTANFNESMYFYFETFDEPWKTVFGGVEPYWGLFDADRKLKSVTLPSCSIPASLTL